MENLREYYLGMAFHRFPHLWEKVNEAIKAYGLYRKTTDMHSSYERVEEKNQTVNYWLKWFDYDLCLGIDRVLEHTHNGWEGEPHLFHIGQATELLWFWVETQATKAYELEEGW